MSSFLLVANISIFYSTWGLRNYIFTDNNLKAFGSYSLTLGNLAHFRHLPFWYYVVSEAHN